MSKLIIKFPEELFELAQSSSFSGDWEVGVLSAGPDEYTFDAPLTWIITVSNVDDAFLLSGSLKGVARVSCGRCLDEYSFSLTGNIEGLCVEESAAVSFDDQEDEEETLILSMNKELDIEPLLRAALLLELPLVPLCKPDCKGLCVQCGAELNSSPCNCIRENAAHDNPFSVLKQLDFD